jgi:soluble lytic murein transglycosylase-like protein
MTTALFALAACAPASAAVPHTVVPGETLWTIAAASNLTTRTVAVFNGLNENSNVVLGSTILIPSIPEGVAALQKAGLYGTPWTSGSAQPTPAAKPGAAAAPATAAPASAPAAPVASTPAGAPKPLGGYTVRPGDSLSALAANSRVSVGAIAAMNGLDVAKPLLAGTVIKLPAGSPTPPNASQPEPAKKIIPAQGPAPTQTRVGAGDIANVANAYGVSPSLASAIAWQESGFNNSMVSAANARGVMQVMPGTWQHVQDALTTRKLDPNSATDNIAAGVIYLKHLLSETGGDEAQAIAGYYQGLGAVRSRGLFDDTKQYVANVQALRARFGG